MTPLNWGLGHATRCIPIINTLLNNNCEVIIASDGAPLMLLQKEFPLLKYYKLPSYNISYSKNALFFKLKLFIKAIGLYPILKKENALINKIIEVEDVEVLISDNRFGVFSSKIKSIYITHQLQVLSGIFTPITSYLHYLIYKKYDEVWVPDFKDRDKSLTGKLSEKQLDILMFINPLSRFKKIEVEQNIDFLFLLSGPEPQRSILEGIFLEEVKKENSKKIILVRGVVENKEVVSTFKNVTTYNFVTSNVLEDLLNRTKTVVCRAGYTTIMDLAVLNKKAFLIPTPGQNEQEYLAEYLNEKGLCPFTSQKKFKWELLEEVKKYKGLSV